MHDKFYNYSFNELRRYLLKLEPKEKQEILYDEKVKRKLIEDFATYKFVWLSQENSNTMLLLLENGGIDILKKSNDLIEKLIGILTSCCDYVDDLFEKKEFNELIVDNFDLLENNFYSLSGKSSKSFFKYLKENDIDKKIQLKFLFSINERGQLDIFRENMIDIDTLKSFIIFGKKRVVEEVLRIDKRIITLSDLSFNELLKMSNNDIEFPRILFLENDFLNRVSTITDVKDYRFLIDSLGKSNNTFFIEDRRKQYYEQEFRNYDVEFDMLKRYKNVYCYFLDNIDKNVCYLVNKLYDMLDFYDGGHQELYYRTNMYNLCSNKDVEGMKKFLQEESNLKISDMIIDYHFEEIYYNFLLDVRQLLHFQQSDGRTLSSDSIEKYQKLVGLDDLSFEEKMNFHQELKKENQKDKYYDDFRNAKDKCFELINNCMLNENSIKAFQNFEMSEKYGVPVYVLDGEEYYAFIKSLRPSKYSVLEKTSFYNKVDGASYSLDSSRKLDTFHDPRTNYNILYGEVPFNQVVHIYPVDSFSSYSRSRNDNGTKRVFELNTPQELVDKSNCYNEIILSQRNKTVKNDELNDSLKLPVPLAIYCYDIITDYDVLSAKNLEIGIVLVETKNYNPIRNSEQISARQTLNSPDKYKAGINYLEYIYQDAHYGRRK